MPHYPRLLRQLLLAATLALCGCVTMQPVDVASAVRGNPPHGVDIGALVVVRTLEGRRERFRVTEMNAGGIGGTPGFFWYDQMQSLEVQQPDDGRAAAIALGVLGVAALVWLFANADVAKVCSGTPC